MKALTMTAFLFLTSFALSAKEIVNTKNNVNVGRVVELVKLVDKTDIKVNVIVTDLGGSTDVSPTQELYFNIYSKGEMFSTDASFALGPIYSLKKATRVAPGIYEIAVVGANTETSMPEDQTMVVNAEKAIVSLKNVKCDDFDCEASTNFTAIIETTLK